MLTGYTLRAKPLNEHTNPWYARFDTDARAMGLTHNPRDALAFSSPESAERFARAHLAPDVTWEVVPTQVKRIQLDDEVDLYPVTESELDGIIALLHRPSADARPTGLTWSDSEPSIDGQIICGSITTSCIEPGTGRVIHPRPRP